ncbi:DUF4097 family beta strand repeat-containing protein [Bacillus spongiae]|uniref:DUF4097 family beta strand repeat-containing protein n=1 Tax=Bacillus spongiae TaxID=2683610 RepID=A0ABU8HGI0_9BACI
MKKLLFGLLAVFLIGIIGTAVSINVTGGSLYNMVFKTVDVHDQKIIKNEKINNIEIRFASTDIQVTPSQDDNFIIELDGKVDERMKDEFILVARELGNNLEVEFLNPPSEIGFFSMVDLSISVNVPEKMYESIEVHSASGNIEVEELSANQIIVSAASGNIQTEESKADHFTISAASGNIKTKELKADQIAIKSASGNVTVQNQSVTTSSLTTISGNISLSNKDASSNITANTTSGNVDINYAKPPSSLYINYESRSGKGTVNLDGVSYKEKSNDLIIGTIGEGNYNLYVDTTSGNFTLQ